VGTDAARPGPGHWYGGLEPAGLGPPDRQNTSRTASAKIESIALNWLLKRPAVSTVLIGARDEEQLRQNLGAVGWSLSAEQVAKLDAASAVTPPYLYYPYWNGQFSERNPAPVSAQPGTREHG
jgi:hypothetical protein